MKNARMDCLVPTAWKNVLILVTVKSVRAFVTVTIKRVTPYKDVWVCTITSIYEHDLHYIFQMQILPHRLVNVLIATEQVFISVSYSELRRSF